MSGNDASITVMSYEENNGRAKQKNSIEREKEKKKYITLINQWNTGKAMYVVYVLKVDTDT